MTPRLTKDFETRSESNLKLEGAYKYSLHPSTQPTCLAIKVRGEKKIWFLPFEIVNTPWKKLPEKFRLFWLDCIEKGFEFSAHNAFFETCIYKNILVKRLGWPDIPFESFRCTAAKAAACALPRNLEGAGEAMQLRVQKDKRGYAAMMATCKPTKAYNAFRKMQADIMVRTHKGQKPTPKQQKWLDKNGPRFDPPPVFLEPLPYQKIKDVLADPSRYDDDTVKRADIWNTLYVYCKFDVRSEEELDESLPDLIPDEQEIWFLNQRLNWRGLPVDIETSKKIIGIMSIESTQKLKELDSLTMGLVTKPGARKSILEFLELEGIILPDIRAKTVDDALAGDDLSEDMRRLLEIRKALSKTSTKKYQAFLNRAMPDGRCRDILLYHGASTGRDTGTGLQPHNFPRGAIKFDQNFPYEPVQNVVDCDADTLRLLYGESLAILFSSILRNMILPSKGKELFVADFSKIEVAVLWWVAGNEPGLKILREGKDPYIYQAAANLGKTYERVEAGVKNEEKWALDARQLGKAQILGCGFGMGWEKFQSTGHDQYRLKLTDKQSRHAVNSYREQNEAVPELWKAYERAAIDSVTNQKTIDAGKCKFIYKVDRRSKTQFLWVELPSGRRLAYANPRVEWRMKQHQKWVDCVKREYAENDPTTRKYKESMTGFQKIENYLTGPHETLEFWAVNSKTKKWGNERTWGGTLTENIVQATARDLMMPAMVRLEKAGYEALLMVHDEGICEKAKGKGNLKEFVKILTAPPKWAKGLPLEAKGWSGPRYRK